MSTENTVLAVARRYVGRAVTYAREFVLIATYAAICIAVIAPTLVATGGGIYWLSGELGLEGTVRTVYFGVGVVVIMVEFAVLHRFVQSLGLAILGPTRDRVV